MHLLVRPRVGYPPALGFKAASGLASEGERGKDVILSF